MLHDLLNGMREKNPEGYAHFIHDLAHAIPAEDLESAAEHARNAQAADESETGSDADPRAIAIAEALERTASEYRSGKHTISPDVIGVDVQVNQLSKR